MKCIATIVCPKFGRSVASNLSRSDSVSPLRRTSTVGITARRLLAARVAWPRAGAQTRVRGRITNCTVHATGGKHRDRYSTDRKILNFNLYIRIY